MQEPKQFSIQDLLDNETSGATAFGEMFRSDPGMFEQALFKLHFRRKKLFSAAQRSRILDFLSTGYLVTRDLRYFNEFLWFADSGADDAGLLEQCRSAFYNNLDAQLNHVFPGATPDDARDYLSRYRLPAEPPFDPTRKVGLIGFPPFFPKIIEGLGASGFTVEQLFIPHHPNTHIKKLIGNPLFVKLLSRYKGNRHTYQTLDKAVDDPSLSDILAEKSFDLGFHKLNCIIRENIYGSFRRGLINDHWGLLPYLRGKSTIAYSVLMGFPMAATMHLIEKGIDTGAIVGYSEEISLNGLNSLAAIRAELRATLPGRAIRALKMLSNESFVPAENERSKGLTFYEIHPWITRFIEREKLAALK